MNCSSDKGIDFIILWVDGNDPIWQAKKEKYLPERDTDTSAARYRDWDNLRYWFRGVAKYAPWVRRIHFVCDDQVPEWLNTENPRIHIVSHGDYMPESALPVFNSSAIEIGLHRTPDLSDKFVYFNDDIFLTAPVDPSYYFVEDLPVDMAGLTGAGEPAQENVFARIQANNYGIINTHFKKKEVLKNHANKWFRPSYGKTFLRTMLNINRRDLAGLVMPHLSVPYRKSDWERVWAIYEERLIQTQHHRFRDTTDLSHFLFRFWRMCEGDFYPRRSKGKYISLANNTVSLAVSAIKRQRYTEICLNDCWDSGDFEEAKKQITAAFKEKLPEKCEFER